MDEPKDRILTKPEAAQRLRVSQRTIDRLCATDGGLKKIQISMRRVGVSERSVDGYIAAEEANATAASGLAAALAEGKTVGPSTAGAKARAALADARDALSVAKSARVLVEERLSSAKSQVDFGFDKVRKGARTVIAAERMEDLISDAVEARAAYVDALGSLAWLVQQHAVPDGDSRVRQLVADGNTPPSAWPEAKIAGIKVMQDAFESLMSDPAAVI